VRCQTPGVFSLYSSARHDVRHSIRDYLKPFADYSPAFRDYFGIISLDRRSFREYQPSANGNGVSCEITSVPPT
jgi:hypothetical protein